MIYQHREHSNPDVSEQKQFKYNINRMFYVTEQEGQNYFSVLKYHLTEAYQQLQKMFEELNKINQFKKGEKQIYTQSPGSRKLFEKFKNLIKFVKHADQQKVGDNSCNEEENNMRIIFPKKCLRDVYFNLKRRFEQSQTKHSKMERFSNIAFEENAQNISNKFKYTIYLPSTVKVILAGVNWIDRQNDIASVALKIQVRVNVPGFNQSENIKELFKKKFKISIKTEDHSYLKNIKVRVTQKSKKQDKDQSHKEKTQSPHIQIVKGNDIFNDTIKGKFYSNAEEFFIEVYKWKNYYKFNQVELKKLKDFEGFIFVAQVNDAKVMIQNISHTSPFQLLDFKGLVEVQSITTEMSEWIENLFGKKQKSKKTEFQKFLEKGSPKITLKFNVISLYEDQTYLFPLRRILFNQIYSFKQIQKDGYELAERLMLLESSNQRTSKFCLKRTFLGYKWEKVEEKGLQPLKKFQYQHKNRFKQKEKQNFQRRVTLLGFREGNQGDKFKGLIIKLKNLKKQFKKIIEKINSQKKDKAYRNIRNNEKERLLQETQMQEINKLGKDEQQLKKLDQSLQMFDIDENSRPSTEDEHETILPIFQGLENLLFKFQSEVQNDLKFQRYQQQRFPLQHKIKYIESIRIKIKKLFQFFLYELLYIKLSLRNSFQNQQQDQQNQQYIQKIRGYFDHALRQKSEQDELRQFKYDHNYNQSKAIYHFPFFREPAATLLLISSSVFILGLINLFIFFQEISLSSRIASISTLMISFLGMITIIQKQIRSSLYSIGQILFYLLFITPILGLLFTYFSYNQQNQDRIAQLAYQSYTFRYCFVVTFLNLLVPLVWYLRFKLFQRPRFNIGLKNLKQAQAFELMLPGSLDIDRIVYLQRPIRAEVEMYQKNRHKTLQRLVFQIMIKHLNQLYNLKDDYQKYLPVEWRKSQIQSLSLFDSQIKSPVKK